MNKTTQYGVMIAAATTLLLACQRRGGELSSETRVVQILSTVSYEKVSKTIASQNTALADVRFLRLDGAEPTSMAGAATFLGQRAASGSIDWTGTTPTYNRDNTTVYFVAYHPSVGEVLGTKIDWVVDGKTDLLLSKPWDAGTYSLPKTGTETSGTPLTFGHALAQIAVVFQAQAGLDLNRVRTQYGEIRHLTFVDNLPTATYTYATNAVTYGGTPTDIALFQADCESVFAPIEIPASGNTTTNAAALLAPNSGRFNMILSTANIASIPLTVQLNTAGVPNSFDAGKKHIITITFKIENAEVVVSACSIVDWKTEYTAGSDVGI